MTKEDILRLRDTAEQTKVQFKERVTRDNKYDVSCEMVAQSNSRGGMIVVGIDDKTGIRKSNSMDTTVTAAMKKVVGVPVGPLQHDVVDEAVVDVPETQLTVV